MNADTFRVSGNAKFAGSPVLRITPAVPDVIHGGSQVDSDLLRRHAEVDLG
jgi:hypothetical protein